MGSTVNKLDLHFDRKGRVNELFQKLLYKTFPTVKKTDTFFLAGNISFYRFLVNKDSIFNMEFKKQNISQKYLFYSNSIEITKLAKNVKEDVFIIDLKELGKLTIKNKTSIYKGNYKFEDKNLNAFMTSFHDKTICSKILKQKFTAFVKFIKKYNFKSIFIFHNGLNTELAKENIDLEFPVLQAEFALFPYMEISHGKNLKNNNKDIYLSLNHYRENSFVHFIFKINSFAGFKSLLLKRIPYFKKLFQKANKHSCYKLSVQELWKTGILLSLFEKDYDKVFSEKYVTNLINNSKPYLQKQKIMGKELFANLLTTPKPSAAFLFFAKVGILKTVLAELYACQNVSQNRFHKYDVFFHSIYACDHSYTFSLHIRFASLFHDLGKVETRREKSNGEASFHSHEYVSKRHARNILKRYGFSYEFRKEVEFLVANHMFHYTEEWSDKAIRRFVSKVSQEKFEELLQLRYSDRRGSGKSANMPAAIEKFKNHIQDVRKKEDAFKITDLKINGNKLMQELQIKPGPELGSLLKVLLEEVEAGRLENKENVLLEYARQ